MIVTASALNDIFTGFNIIFQNQYQGLTPKYPMFSMTVNSDSDQETYGWLDAIPGLREWIGNRQYHDLKQQGQTLVNQLFENTVWLKRTDVEDDRIGFYNTVVAQVANNLMAKKEYEAVKRLLLGFTTNGYDGTTFFSASHTWRGTTRTNTSNLALSEDNFNALVETLYTNVASIGSKEEAPIMVDLSLILICGPHLRATAKKIVERSTNDLGASNINMDAASLLVHPFINGDYANYWFLAVTNNPIKPIIFQNRLDVETTWITDPESALVFDRDAYAYGIRSRFTTGYGLPHLIVGSTGSA